LVKEGVLRIGVSASAFAERRPIPVPSDGLIEVAVKREVVFGVVVLVVGDPVTKWMAGELRPVRQSL
jgi:hypothetical protein